MKTIIVATDFSPIADNAAKYGICMALALNANVILFHAYALPVNIGEVPVLAVPGEEMKNATEQQLLTLKKEMDLIALGKVKIDIVASVGDTIIELEDLCNKTIPLTVVMGTHSISNIEQVFFGSITLKAIHHLTCPVLAVPPNKQFGDGIKKIGFACDLHAIGSTTPVHLIKEFVNEFHAHLHVLHADLNSHTLPPEIERQSQALHHMLKDVNPSFHFIQYTDIEDGINEFADANSLDLLIAIPKKHTWLKNIFHAGATKKLVLHSHIPVMCLHE